MNKYFNWLKRLAQGRTLASQILLYFLVAAFIVTVAVGSFTYLTVRHRLKEQLTERFNDDARLMATYIAQTIATGYYDIQLLSYNSVITSPTASLADKLMEMEKTQWLHRLFEDITLLNLQGVPVAHTGDSSIINDEATQEVFRTVSIGFLYPYVSDVQVGSNPDHMVIILGAPVFDRGLFEEFNMIAVVTAQMNMEQIWRFTDSMKMGKTGYVAVVDSSNHYIAHPNKEMLSRHLASKTVSVKGDKLFSYLETAGGDERTGLLSQTISDPPWINKGWRVVISQDSGEAFNYLRQTLWLILGIISIAILLFMIVGLLVSSRLSQPLRVLAKGTHRIALGEFSHRMTVNRRDEIGNLARAYNEMAIKLEQRESDSRRLQMLRKAVGRWTSVSGTLSVAKYLSNLTEAILDTFRCSSVWVLLTRGKKLESGLFSSSWPEARRVIENTLGQDIKCVSFDVELDDNPFTQAFNTRQSIFVKGPISAGEGIVDSLLLGGHGEVAALPLCTGMECRGVLVLVQDTFFPPEQKENILALALHSSVGLENALLYETAQRQSQEKSRLYELAGVMSSSLDFREVLNRALEGVMSLVPAPETAWTVITRFDELTKTFAYEASRGKIDVSLEDLKVHFYGLSPQWVAPLLEGKVIMQQDINLLPEKQRFPIELSKEMQKAGMKSWVVIPLMVKGHLIGTLRIANKLPLLPNDIQLDALRNLANNIAIAMENARLYTKERQRATELQSLEQLKTDFMLALSHELKTPLTSLSVSAGLLQEEVKTALGTPINRLLVGMVNSVDRLNRLVSDLLEAARLESSTLELNREFADIVSTVKAAAITFSTLIESKRQQFIMDVPQEGLWAWADLQRLEQIVSNLLSNAHKFTPVGGRIRLVLKEEGENFVLEVSDTGPGIPDDEQLRIFEPFYRARGMPRHTGSGLGLTIARRLTELHGGGISVHSQVGQGATFTITIPKGVDKEDERSAANR